MTVADACESCAHYSYNADEDIWSCERDLDEDEMLQFLTGRTAGCPYYSPDDGEYALVRKQN